MTVNLAFLDTVSCWFFCGWVFTCNIVLRLCMCKFVSLQSLIKVCSKPIVYCNRIFKMDGHCTIFQINEGKCCWRDLIDECLCLNITKFSLVILYSVIVYSAHFLTYKEGWLALIWVCSQNLYSTVQEMQCQFTRNIHLWSNALIIDIIAGYFCEWVYNHTLIVVVVVDLHY